MFCNNCGAKIPENSKFCNSCGARITVEKMLENGDSSNKNGIQSGTSDTEHVGVSLEIQSSRPFETNQNNSAVSSFKEFVDLSVRQATGFKTAEELLNSKNHYGYNLLGFGIPLILALFLMMKDESPSLTGVLVLLLFAGGIGAFITFLIDRAKISKHIFKSRKSSDKDIDPDELIHFLNANLSYLPNLNNKWDHIITVRVGRN